MGWRQSLSPLRVPQKSPSEGCSERAKLSIPVSSETVVTLAMGELLCGRRAAAGMVEGVAGDPVTFGGPAPETIPQPRLIKFGQPLVPDRDQFGDADGRLDEDMRDVRIPGVRTPRDRGGILQQAMAHGDWHEPRRPRLALDGVEKPGKGGQVLDRPGRHMGAPGRIRA
jgi:hypothetical protein